MPTFANILLKNVKTKPPNLITGSSGQIVGVGALSLAAKIQPFFALIKPKFPNAGSSFYPY